MSCSTRQQVDPFANTDETRWTVAQPPIIGEVSSEGRPEPISPITLKRIAAKGRARSLPRIATPTNQGPDPTPAPVQVATTLEADLLEAIPKVGYAEQYARREARRAGRRLRRREALEAKLALQPNCLDCGIPMLSENRRGSGARYAVVRERDGKQVLVCQHCVSMATNEQHSKKQAQPIIR